MACDKLYSASYYGNGINNEPIKLDLFIIKNLYYKNVIFEVDLLNMNFFLLI